MENEKHSARVRIEITWKTIIKVLLGVLLAFVAVKLWPLFKLLIVSILLAVPLYRLVLWVCRRGWPRRVGNLLVSLALLVGVVGVGALVGPVVFTQASNLGENLPRLREEMTRRVPAGPLRNLVEQATDFKNNENFKLLAQNGLTAAIATAGGLLDFVLVMALTIYLIVDGPRALEWLITYFPRGQRQRVATGLDKIGDRVVRYIIGQSIVSGLFAGYVLIVLSMLHVPMALLLAVAAGILDVAPVIGISITLMLGGAIGMTVSSNTALLVVALIGAYHGLENYLIIPKVYGKQLRLSTLAVLLSMIAGGMVAGVIGAVAILPVVAAYPALETLWLSRQLEPEVVKDHQEQLRAA